MGLGSPKLGSRGRTSIERGTVQEVVNGIVVEIEFDGQSDRLSLEEAVGSAISQKSSGVNPVVAGCVGGVADSDIGVALNIKDKVGHGIASGCIQYLEG